MLLCQTEKIPLLRRIYSSNIFYCRIFLLLCAFRNRGLFPVPSAENKERDTAHNAEQQHQRERNYFFCIRKPHRNNHLTEQNESRTGSMGPRVCVLLLTKKGMILISPFLTK